MKLLPIIKFQLISERKPEEIISRLREQTDKRPAFRFKKPAKYFEGEISSDSFRIARALFWGRGLPPVLVGRMNAENDGAHIYVTQHPGMFGWVWLAFLTFLYALILSILLAQLITGEDLGISTDILGVAAGLIAPPLMAFMMFRDFWKEADESKKVLKDIINGNRV